MLLSCRGQYLFRRARDICPAVRGGGAYEDRGLLYACPDFWVHAACGDVYNADDERGSEQEGAGAAGGIAGEEHGRRTVLHDRQQRCGGGRGGHDVTSWLARPHAAQQP